MSKKKTAYQLLVPFLQIGLFSFGGFLSMISFSRKLIVEKHYLVSEEDFDNGVAYVLLLPGPTALNFCGYIGILHSGIAGLTLAVFSASIPSLLMLVVIGFLYEHGIDLSFIQSCLSWIPFGIASLILVVSINMFNKQKSKGNIIAVIILILFFELSPFHNVVTFLILVIGSVIYCAYKYGLPFAIKIKNFSLSLILILLVLLLGGVMNRTDISDLLTQFISISYYSVSMFGGGYVFIPLMEELLVEQNSWITTAQFYDGLAFAQVTPGPIMISMYFFGFLNGGVITGVVFFLGITFLPLVFVTLSSKYYYNLLKIEALSKAIKMIQLIVVSLLCITCFEILISHLESYDSLFIFNILAFLLISFLHLKNIINPFHIIIISVLIGLLVY